MQHLFYVNYLSVFLAGLSAFIFGGIYYTVFSKQWMAAHEIKHNPEGMTQWQKIAPMLYCFLAQMLMAFIFYGVLSHMPKITVVNGLISGFLLWLGFVVTTVLVNYNFIGKSRDAKLLDGFHWLFILLIQGAILGWFGK